MTKPRVLVDVDDVLGDYHGAAAALMTSLFGRPVSAEELTQWDVTNGLEDIGEKRRCWDGMRARGFCSSIPVIDGAQAGVDELMRIADVYFVTAPMKGNPTWVHERTGWMMRHFRVDIDRIAFLRCKHIVPGRALVDDNEKNVADWAEAHPQSHALLWDRHFNRGGTARRVRSWAEVHDLVRSL